MPILPFAPVTTPVPQAARYRLLTVANGPVEVGADGEPIRIFGGVTYEPMFCGGTHDYPIVCSPQESPGESPGEFEKIFDPQDPNVQWDPFLLYASLQCGSAGHRDMPTWMRERVEQRFETGEATGVERNFARVLAAAGLPELVPPDPTDIVSVIGTLEQWLYGVQDVVSTLGTAEGLAYNWRGYIHATPRVAAYASDAHLIVERPGPLGTGLAVENGTYKTTPLGSVWVFGGGYSGALPGAAAAVDGTDAIYITGQVTVWRDGQVIDPDIRQIFDRGANQWRAILERAYAVGFDCGGAAAPFEYGTVSP